MYKVDRKFIGTNGHVYEKGDLVQRHVYNHFTGKHKRRCSYTADITVGKTLPPPTPAHNVVQESKPENVEVRNDETSGNGDDTILAAGIGAGLGLIAGEILGDSNDTFAADPTPDFGGFGGGDSGGGGAGDSW